jgi:glycyl-tRNA synthetase beta chain
MRRTLLIELLTEELPPKALRNLSTAFADDVFAALREQQLASRESVCTPYATPRRLAMMVSHVAAQQEDRVVERKGPAVAAGLDAEGKPTKALEGFMRSAGVAFEQLQRVQDGKAGYFVARIEQKGKPLDAYLAGIVAQALKKLPVPKLMRWGDYEHQFVRPVHGLVMMHGNRVVPGEVLGLRSGNVTRGHRFLHNGEFPIVSADGYEDGLLAHGKVVPSFEARRTRISKLLEERAKLLNARINPTEGLLDEVTALVEWPAVYVGEFEAEFLEVPQECLILTMQQNQKYFPLLDATGKLLNKFLIVSNMEVQNPVHIIGGNQRVVRPRLSDARFFYDQDRKQTLESRVEKLGGVVYHNKLGTQLQRTARVTTLAGTIARLIDADKADAELAARLSKADLLTGMVGEFPELQGVMGRYYALHDGEKPEVADAIEAHYHPRFAGDTLPQGALACAVALSDKLETVLGIYGVGQAPTGDKDPFGLRRHALGILRILIETPISLPLGALLRVAVENFPPGILSATVVNDVEGFMLDRLRSYLRDRGFEATHIEAVLHVLNGRLYQVLPRLEGVREFAALNVAADLAAANKRVQNIIRKNHEELGVVLENATINPALFMEPGEKDLYQAIMDITPMAKSYVEQGKYGENMKTLVTLKPFVDGFFDKVMVMCEDKALRQNRAVLLQHLGRLMNQVADISRLAV